MLAHGWSFLPSKYCLWSASCTYGISQSEKIEAVILQPPYHPIKIANKIKNLQGFKVTKFCTYRKFTAFSPKVPIQTGKLLHRVLCWICVNFSVKCMHIVGFALLSIGICPCYSSRDWSFEIWAFSVMKTYLNFTLRHHVVLDQWGNHQLQPKLAYWKKKYWVRLLKAGSMALALAISALEWNIWVSSGCAAKYMCFL